MTSKDTKLQLLAESEEEIQVLERALIDLRSEVQQLEWRRRKLEEHSRVLRELIEGPGEPPSLPDSAAGSEEGRVVVEEVPESEPEAKRNTTPQITRAEAIRQVLADAPGPLSPKEIAHRLPDFGRDGQDTARDVSAALEGLKRGGDVRRVERARWALETSGAERASQASR